MQIFPVMFPLNRVGTNGFTDMHPFAIVKDNMFIKIPLPDGSGQGLIDRPGTKGNR